MIYYYLFIYLSFIVYAIFTCCACRPIGAVAQGQEASSRQAQLKMMVFDLYNNSSGNIQIWHCHVGSVILAFGRGLPSRAHGTNNPYNERISCPSLSCVKGAKRFGRTDTKGLTCCHAAHMMRHTARYMLYLRGPLCSIRPGYTHART
jgi:hypothetical protein